MNIKRWLFECYLMFRFMFYGVDDPRQEEMIRRKEALKQKNNPLGEVGKNEVSTT